MVSAPPIIEAIDIRKSFMRGTSRTEVLRGANLAVREREVVLIAGPSGSGKSTLLAILGCMLTPDAGTVRLDGQVPYNLTANARAKLRGQSIGYIFQRCHLINGLSALENIMLVSALRGRTRREAQQIAHQLLESVDMSEHVAAVPEQMSLGQCQRVAVARALATDPRIVLADEPTASLDHENGIEVIQLIRKLAKQGGRAAIIVSHDQRVFSYADRVLWVDHGQVHSVDPTSVAS